MSGWAEFEGRVAVEVKSIGEGLCEEYNADDPDDVELLRFTVMVRGEPDADDDGEWLDVPDASYCTQLPASLPIETQHKAARYVLFRVLDEVLEGLSIKKACEGLSWINEQWVERWVENEREKEMLS